MSEKKCLTCDQILSTKSIKPHCKRCRHKQASLKWVRKNQEHINQYQKEYREKNRDACNQRTRISYWKKPEEYNKKGKIHYREVHGIPLDDPFTKRRHGEGTYHQGYKVITSPDPNHPNNHCKGRIREHIWVMSQMLNRPLNKGEIVHHKNGIRNDNRPENLELCYWGQPPGQRVNDLIEYYLEFLSRYGKVSWEPNDDYSKLIT